MKVYLEHIVKMNPLINAIVEQLSAEKALGQAREANNVIANKGRVGKLHGVPISIKQGRKVKGFLCNFAAESPMNFVATEDATVVARLRAEGAIVIGISNIPEFSMSYDTDN